MRTVLIVKSVLFIQGIKEEFNVITSTTKTLYTLQYFLYIAVLSICCSTFYTLQYFLYVAVLSIHCSTFYMLQYLLYVAVLSIHCSTFYMLQYFLYVAVLSIHCSTFYVLQYSLVPVLYVVIYSIISRLLCFVLFNQMFLARTLVYFINFEFSNVKFFYIFSKLFE